MKRYPVPSVFQVPDRFYYPEDNFPDFEYWFMQNLNDSELMFDRIYLPILFTSYFKRNGYGNAASTGMLQNFVDSLPTTEKYFCVVQYDDGVLIDWKGRDVAVFAMSGKPENCIPIPLVCQPHQFKFPDVSKDIGISFIGRITNPVREKIIDWGQYKSDFYITSKSHTLYEYCSILARSKYVLCPRGYGASSFRIAEALQYSALPIILRDVKDKIYECPLSIIYDYEKIENSDLDCISMSVGSFSGFLPLPGSENEYQKYYSFEGVKKTILDGLWNLQ